MKARKLKSTECWTGFIDNRGGSWWASSVQLFNGCKIRRCRSWIQAVRVSLGLSQNEMAKILNISKSYLCKIEIGAFRAPEHITKKVAEMHSDALSRKV